MTAALVFEGGIGINVFMVVQEFDGTEWPAWSCHSETSVKRKADGFLPGYLPVPYIDDTGRYQQNMT